MMIKTVKHFLMAEKSSHNDEVEYGLYPFDFSTSDKYNTRVLVKTLNIELDIPDGFDMRPQQIAALEAQKQKARADFELLMNTIDGKIQSLKCIDHRAE